MSKMRKPTQQDKIQQMINFIESEAQEKAHEIEVQANEEFAIEKQNIVEAEKKRIRAEYERKEKEVEVEKQIKHSNAIKDARLEILKLKEEIMKDVLRQAQEEAIKFTKDTPKYKQLLADLILQGLNVLKEKKADVFAREEDFDLIESQLDDITKRFEEMSGIKCNITLQKSKPLPKESCGGVIIATMGDRIKVNNTLEERIKLCYEQQIPALRRILFPKLQEII